MEITVDLADDYESISPNFSTGRFVSIFVGWIEHASVNAFSSPVMVHKRKVVE